MCIIEFSLGVHVCYTADILVSNNIQWSMGKKQFHRRYAATYKATYPTFTYIEDAIICVINMQDLDG